MCRAGAAEKGMPLYRYLADMVGFIIINCCPKILKAGNKQVVLPVPSFNVINGGSHAGNGLAMVYFFIGCQYFLNVMYTARIHDYASRCVKLY